MIDVSSDLTGELGTVALNQWVEDGVGGYTLLIRPTGAARRHRQQCRRPGPPQRRRPDDDRRLDRERRQRSGRLTIQNTNTGTSAVVIAVQTGTNGAQNNTLKNLVLVAGSDDHAGGLALGGNTPGTAGTDNDGNRVENCAVKRGIYGIYSAGRTPPIRTPAP